MLNLLKINLFFLGLVSLFAIPRFNGFTLIHFFLMFSFLISFFYFLINIKYIKFKEMEIFILVFGLLYVLATIVGAIVSESYKGILSSFIFLLVYLIAFFIYKINYKLYYSFFKGFVIGAIITAIYVIVDEIFFYLHGIPLNEYIFPKSLLGLGMHGFKNLIKIFGVILYRPSGFSWDPGISITGLAVAFILLNEDFVKIKFKSFFLFLLLVAMILAVSKTSILSIVIYFFIKLIQNKMIVIDERKISLLIISFFVVLFFMMFLGLFLEYNCFEKGAGNIRHLKYLSSIFYYPYQNFFEIIFGYGYTGVGVFFNKYVTWFNSMPCFYFRENLTPENTLVNLFFYGGLLGLIFWIFIFSIILFYGNNKFRLLLIILIIIMNGYNINSVWFNFIIFSMFFISFKNYYIKRKIYYEKIIH